MTTARLLAAALLLASALPVLAEEDYVPNCKDPQTQSDFNVCAFQDFEAADKALNAEYKRSIAAMQTYDFTSMIDRLKKAQRVWIQFRDAHCDTEATLMEGGSAQPQILYECKATVTKTRTQQLKAMREAM